MFQSVAKFLVPLLSNYSRSVAPDELHQMSSFCSSDLDKFKLETQLKTLIHIADENKLVLKLIKLILLVPANIVVSERPYSTLRGVKT